MYACIAIILLLCSHQKKNSQLITKVNNTIGYQYGTYEGVLKESNHHSYYVQLSLDSMGNYELYEKRIGGLISNFNKGKITTHIHNEILNLELGEGLVFAVNGVALRNDKLELKFISTSQSINPSYYNYVIKDNHSGNNYTIKIYSESGIKYAEFEFKGKQYKLPVNNENSQEIEFTNDVERFWWNINDPAPLADYQPVFYNGKEEYVFTLLSPSIFFYRAEDESSPINSLDVLYYNPEQGNSFVRIVSENITYCYELQQTEASSKTGTYEANEVEWHANNKNEATLNIRGHKFSYTNQLP